MAWEKSRATPGIDPGTFRQLAHCLKRYPNPGPQKLGAPRLFLKISSRLLLAHFYPFV